MTAPQPATGPPRTLDRRSGPYGEVALREHDGRLEIIANGCFLMDTSNGHSERLLVNAALRELAPRPAPTLLLGGLGVGFSLAEAATEERWGRIAVAEREAAIIEWHRDDGPLSAVTAQALRDPRTELLHGDLLELLQHRDTAEYDAICLDIDNGPDWTVTEDNGALYSPAGLASCRARLTTGGVLAVWSAQPSATFEDTLRNAGFHRVHTEEIPVARGVPDVVHFATKPA